MSDVSFKSKNSKDHFAYCYNGWRAWSFDCAKVNSAQAIMELRSLGIYTDGFEGMIVDFDTAESMQEKVSCVLVPLGVKLTEKDKLSCLSIYDLYLIKKNIVDQDLKDICQVNQVSLVITEELFDKFTGNFSEDWIFCNKIFTWKLSKNNHPQADEWRFFKINNKR